MEDFAAKDQKGIKEKNIWILHLDTPRIIIISSVIAGLIIISVLIGMNINKLGSVENDNFASDSSAMENLNSNLKNSIENSNSEPGLNSDNMFKNQESLNPIITADNPLKENTLKDNLLTPSDNPANNKENILASDIGKGLKENSNSSTDILTHENIENIIQPVNTVKKTEVKKHTKKTHEKRSEKRKGIMEVSETSPVEKSYNKSHAVGRTYYAIQVASFDKKSKALAEVNYLEKKKYNAYLDSAKVNDKTYYRVLVGPVYSKKKAGELIDEISADNRYEESYIIKK